MCGDLRSPLMKISGRALFVLVTSGFAFLALGVSIYVVDMKGYTQGTKFGIIYGANAITAYVMGDIFCSYFFMESIMAVKR